MTSATVILVSLLIFGVGVLGVVVRRNALTLALSVQLMFAASLPVLAAHDRRVASNAAAPSVDGTLFAWVVLAVMAAELAVAIAVAISLVRQRGSLDVERADGMHG